MLYVNDARDTAPKRLGRSEFETLIGSAAVAEQCLWARRYADALAEARLRGDEAACAWWERELRGAKGRLPGFIFQGTMRDAGSIGREGTRNGTYIGSNGKVMIDIDHMSREEMERVAHLATTVCEEDGRPFARRVGLVAITPSGAGMRLVLGGREGSTLVDDQRWVAGLLGVTIDECCKDYTRLSFAVPRSNVLYYRPEVLFAPCKPYAERSVACQNRTAHARWEEPTYMTLSAWDEADIVSELEQELGGAPVQGNRNNFVYRMACALRHLHGDNAEAICRAIPTYRLSDGERRQAVRSALSRPLGSYVPRCIYKRLNH